MVRWIVRWAVRVVVIGCALLGVAVGVAAGMHWKQGRVWRVTTPGVYSWVVISPQYVDVVGWRRSEWDPQWSARTVGRYWVNSEDWDNSTSALRPIVLWFLA